MKILHILRSVGKYDAHHFTKILVNRITIELLQNLKSKNFQKIVSNQKLLPSNQLLELQLIQLWKDSVAGSVSGSFHSSPGWWGISKFTMIKIQKCRFQQIRDNYAMIIHDTIPYNYLPQIEYNSIEEQNRAKKCHHFPSVKMSNSNFQIRS